MTRFRTNARGISPTGTCGLLGAVCLLIAAAGCATERAAKAPPTGEEADRVANQQWTAANTQEIKKADTPDKFFVLATAEENIFELQLAKIARDKAQSPPVKALAEHLYQDHRKLVEQLQTLSGQLALPNPQGLSPMMQQEIQILRSQDGDRFDGGFVSTLKALHAKQISKFEDMAKAAKDDRVKQFAAQTLPTLREHQKDLSK